MLVPLPRYLPPCTTHVGGCSDDQLSEPLPFKNFGTSVGSEEQERSAHMGQRTSGADRTLGTWLPLKPEALLLLTVDVFRLRYNAAQTLVRPCAAPPTNSSATALQ